MTDDKTTIRQLKEHMADFVERRDWQQFHSPKNLAIGMAIETGELLEHFQWISEQGSRDVANDPVQMEQVKAEVADVLSYILALADVMKIDLSDAFYEKMKHNEKKYPVDTYRGKYGLESRG